MNYFYSTLNEIISFIICISLLGIFFYFLEKLNPAEKDTPFFKRDMKNEILLAVFNILIHPAISVIILGITVYFITPLIPYHIFNSQILMLPFALQILLAMLIQDFSIYWRHRFSHYSFWSFHLVHHSAEQITWTTKLRLHPVDIFLATIFDTAILYFLGFEGNAIIVSGTIVMMIDFFAHSNLNIRLPKPFRYLLATPHSHRWHHATLREAYDKNFCAVFPFYDVLFGTFYHPEELPPALGLSKPEQKNFPADNILGWLTYPLKREIKRFKKNYHKNP